jgi:pilus assembly protein CpaE
MEMLAGKAHRMNAQNLSVLALLRSEGTRESLNGVWAGMNGHKVDIRMGAIDSRALSRMPDVLLIEVDPESDRDIQALREAKEREFAGRPIIATAENLPLEAVRKLMRAGVSDVLPQPFSRNEIVAALETVARATQTSHAAPREGGCVVSFLKGGGGAGATTLAVQSACALPEKTKGETKHDVCLVDLDVQLGQSSLHLDIESRTSLQDLIGAAERLDGTLLRSVMAQHQIGLDLLPGPPEILPLDTVTDDFAQKLIDVVRSEYRMALVELPSAWTTWSTLVLDQSDLIVLVTQMTVPAIREARRQLEALQREGLDDGRIRIVLNRFEKSWTNRGEIKNAEQALGRRIDAFIPSDFKLVSQAANEGVPLSELKARSKVVKAIRRFAQSLQPQAVEPRVPQGTARSQDKEGAFQQCFLHVNPARQGRPLQRGRMVARWSN